MSIHCIITNFRNEYRDSEWYCILRIVVLKSSNVNSLSTDRIEVTLQLAFQWRVRSTCLNTILSVRFFEQMEQDLGG
jgi:hypothetical protein